MTVYEKKRLEFPKAGQNVRHEVEEFEGAVRSKGNKVSEELRNTTRHMFGKRN